MTSRRPLVRPPLYDKKVALILQGGGALGRRARHRSGVRPTRFFVPPLFQDWFAREISTSHYNTNGFKCTLERLVDFDRINNSNEMRLSVGAVNLHTGDFTVFEGQ